MMSPVFVSLVNGETISNWGQAVWKKVRTTSSLGEAHLPPPKPTKEPDPQLVYITDDNANNAKDEREGRISGN